METFSKFQDLAARIKDITNFFFYTELVPGGFRRVNEYLEAASQHSNYRRRYATGTLFVDLYISYTGNTLDYSATFTFVGHGHVNTWIQVKGLQTFEVMLRQVLKEIKGR